jgi:hypothetical protein
VCSPLAGALTSGNTSLTFVRRVGDRSNERLLVALAVASMAAASCSGKVRQTPAPDDGGSTDPTCAEIVNGSRLRAMVNRGDDGSLATTGDWYDSQFDSPCIFAPAADGTFRCVPSGAAVVSSGAILYSDAACQSAILYDGVISPRRTVPARYALVPDPGLVCIEGQITQNHVFPVINPPLDPTATYFISSSGSCDPFPLDPGTTVYAPGAEIPPTSFVEGSVEKSPAAAGGRLERFRLTAGDGAQALRSIYDPAAKSLCRFDRAADGVMRCLPISEFASFYYEDPACTTNLAISEVSTCDTEPPGSSAYTRTTAAGDSCYLRTDTILGLSRNVVHPVGDKIGSGTVYEKSSSEADCMSVDMPAVDWYEVGAEIAPTTFVDANVEARACGPGAAAGSRLQPKFIVASDGLIAGGSRWYDSMLDVDCAFGPAADGASRCVPAENDSLVFADADCTHDLAASDLCLSEGAPKYVAEIRTQEQVVHIRTVGSPVAAPSSTYTNIGGCRVSTAPAAVQYYEAGPEIDPGTFVARTLGPF